MSSHDKVRTEEIGAAQPMKIHCSHDKLVRIKDLKLHPQNRNKHPKDQIERLAEILAYQGFRYPIKVSNRSGFVTAGHGRIEAAKLNKWAEVPVNFQDYEDEEQEYADLIADNAIASWAELDLASLHVDLQALDGLKLNVDLLGIKDFKFEPDSLNTNDEDAIPEKVVPRSKLGDLYELGEHRLLCGDSTDLTQVERLMNGNKADMVFTDPPYNHASEEKLVASSVSTAMKDLSNSEWDKNFSFLDVADSITAVLAENATVYVCTSWHLAGEIWAWMKEHSSHYSYCVWHKPNPMPSLMKRHWTWASELICYATYGKHVFNFPAEGHAPNVWEVKKNQVNDLHPTMKPVEIPEIAIKHSSNAGAVVLDLFGGSGSTLIACEKTKRRCFMMELDPHYCDVIVARWEEYSGKKAKLL